MSRLVFFRRFSSDIPSASNSIKPVIYRPFPYYKELEEGKKYYWCACGLSANQPFCDGAHKGTGIVPLAFIAEKKQKKLVCACKQTKTPPYCDFSHVQEIPGFVYKKITGQK